MLRIRTVGGFKVEVAGRDRTSPVFDRPTALLAWLALNPGLHPRASVAARFWPDIRDESARASLRSALWALRRQLGDDANGALIATRDRVGLADDVWVDVVEAARLRDAGRFDEALELVEGDLLPELEDEWAYEAREEHRARTIELLEALAAEAETRGGLRRAVDLSRRAAALDPLSEEAHRALMRRLGAAGDRGSALAVYSELRTRLLQTIRIAPSDETRRLAESLRVDPANPTVPPRLRRIDDAVFVGRQDELARLRRLHEPSDTVRFAVLAGEAGSGKTRLAARFASEWPSEGGTVLYGACAEQALVPFEPFADAVGESGLDPEEIEARLAAHAAYRLLLVLDDLQWADRATLALVGRIVRGRVASRLAVIGTYREDEAGADLYAALANLRRDCDLQRIDLGGLDATEVTALIRSASETRAAVAQAPAIHTRTGGNPFYVRELARHIAEHPRTALGDVPEGVRDLVRARVKRLSDDASDALAAAAVIGEAFDVSTLAPVATRADAAALIALLDEGVAAGLIDEISAGQYRFWHALTRDAVYAGVGATTRARLHRAVAAALADRHGLEPGPQLAEIALHLCAGAADGTNPEEAVNLAERGAIWALERGADGQAVTLLTHALAVLPEHEIDRRRVLARQRTLAYVRLSHTLYDAPSWSD